MTEKIKILVIDDEKAIGRLLQHSLGAQGFGVVVAQTGKDGLQRIIEEKPDLIILDHGLPDLTGIETLKELRQWSKVPVIFLTVRDAETDKVEALDLGADDYLTKPFSVPELLARIRVALRHAKQEEDQPVFKNGALEIDFAAHLVRIQGKEVKISATEFAILSLLAKHAGKVVSHRTLLNQIWGPNAVERLNYLRVYFAQIRRKLEQTHPGAGNYIENESGVGYRLIVNE